MPGSGTARIGSGRVRSGQVRSGQGWTAAGRKGNHPGVAAYGAGLPRPSPLASSAPVRTVKLGSAGPVFISSTVARFRHFATVLGVPPFFAAIDPSDHLLIARTPGSAARALRPAPEPMAGRSASRERLLLLPRRHAWSWSCHDELVPKGTLPFQRMDRILAPPEQTTRAGAAQLGHQIPQRAAMRTVPSQHRPKQRRDHCRWQLSSMMFSSPASDHIRKALSPLLHQM